MPVSSHCASRWHHSLFSRLSSLLLLSSRGDLGSDAVDELRFQRPDSAWTIITSSLSLHRVITSSVAHCPFKAPLLFQYLVVAFLVHDVPFFIAVLCLVPLVEGSTTGTCFRLRFTRQQRARTANEKVCNPRAVK